MEIIVQEVKQQPIVFNYPEIKKWLGESLEKYKGLVFNDEQIKEAKETRAKLNKLKDAFSAKRIEIKKAHAMPFEDFETKMKELESEIVGVISGIDSQVKKFEESKKAEKFEKIKAFYSDAVDKIGSEMIPLSKVMNDKWLNAGYTIANIEKEIKELFAGYEKDLSILEQKTEFKQELINKFFETLNLGDVLTHEMRLQQQKKAQEEKEAKEKAILEAKQMADLEAQQRATGFTPQAPVEEPVPVQATQQVQEVQQAVQPAQTKTVEIKKITMYFELNPAQYDALKKCIMDYKIPCQVVKQ